MRIVHILDSLATGGAERMAVDLAIEQQRSGHEAAIYCISGDGDLAVDARRAGIHVTNFAKPPGISLGALWRICKSLRRDGPEVLHTHNPPAHYYGAVAGFLARVPVILNTRHSPVSSRPDYSELYFRWLLPITSEVVFVSTHARETVRAQWGTPHHKGLPVIPNGISVSKFRALPARPGSNRPGFTFGTVGRLAPVKAHHVLIEAFRRVREQCPQAKLRIAGGGPLAGALQEQVSRLELSESVRIDPPTLDVAAVLSTFDTFVISSDSEGLPLVVLEAMAAGLPIVSTRVGGIPEAVPEDRVAWFCPPSDPQALAAAMLAAYHAGNLEERGRAASELAFTRFDVQRMADQYGEIIRRVLAASPQKATYRTSAGKRIKL